MGSGVPRPRIATSRGARARAAAPISSAPGWRRPPPSRATSSTSGTGASDGASRGHRGEGLGTRPCRCRHRPDHSQAVPEADRANRVRSVPLPRLEAVRRDRAGPQPHPRRGSQLRLRIVAGACGVGAAGLRLRGGGGPVVRGHLLRQLHQERAAARDPGRGALPGDRSGRRGTGRRRRADGRFRRGRGAVRDRRGDQAPAAPWTRRDRDHAPASRRDRLVRASRRCRSRPGNDIAVSRLRTSHVGPREWNADVYHRVSLPQYEWATEVLKRVELRGDEVVLDAGCGSGRVTALLAERVPRGRVIGVDASESMVAKARETLGPEVELHVASLTELELEEEVDLVFSNAVFHWISDHDLLFHRLHRALKPGGTLAAQCGGGGNVASLGRAIRAVATAPPLAEHLADFDGAWNFSSADAAERRLRGAGFRNVRCWLEPR